MPERPYERGLFEVGDGLFAWIQPDGTWGWSNAGLVVDEDASLLVDTLFDLPLTRAMLDAMADASPAARKIDVLVNTHANGDHCYGNQLVGDARILASRASAEEMDESSTGRRRNVYPVIDGENKVRRFSRELGGDFVEPFARQLTPNVQSHAALVRDIGCTPEESVCAEDRSVSDGVETGEVIDH